MHIVLDSYQMKALIWYILILHMRILFTTVRLKIFYRNYQTLRSMIFLKQMKSVTSESYRVLKFGKFCAILMGDTCKKGHTIPLSFKTMQIFEEADFRLMEIIMKEQHNCRATGYWKTNSIKYNFLLLAHEYLFIFENSYYLTIFYKYGIIKLTYLVSSCRASR